MDRLCFYYLVFNMPLCAPCGHPYFLTLLDFSLTVKAAPHECVIRTSVVRTCDPTLLLYIFGNEICLN